MLIEALIGILNKPRAEKTADEVQWTLAQMEKHGSIEHAKRVAYRFAHRAQHLMDTRLSFLPPSEAKRFLRALVDYVVYREL